MDILSHPERTDTATPAFPRAELREGSVHCSSDGARGAWTALGKYCDGHGWDIDVRLNGKLVAMRNGAHGSRDSGMDLVADTLDDVINGRAVGNTWFV